MKNNLYHLGNETGRCLPSIDLLKPLCKQLGIELNELPKETQNQKESYEKIILKELKRKQSENINLFLV